jgi:hypothetical protein
MNRPRLTFSRTRFPSAGRHPSDVADGHHFALGLGRKNENRILSRSHEAVIGVLDVKAFSVRRKNGVRLEWGCALQVSDFFGDHGYGRVNSDERNLIPL